MEITETKKLSFTIQLTPHEYEQLEQFCVQIFLDKDVFIHLFFRSMYNFIVQYLMATVSDGK